MSPVEELKELKRVALNESSAGSKCLHFLLRCALPATDGTTGRSWVLQMTRARGQPPRTLLDRKYPHQILVLAENVHGKTLDKVSDFHAKLGITRKSRSERKDDACYSLYCFADREHAKLFQAMFGGELLAQTQSKA
jgi:hypothetical protein